MAAYQPQHSRRLGRRGLVQFHDWSWQVWPIRPKGSKKRHVVTARVIEVSVTSALLQCPTLAGVVVNHRIGFDANGLAGTAVVRRIEPLPDGLTYYGVEFITIDPDLGDQIYSTLTHLE